MVKKHLTVLGLVLSLPLIEHASQPTSRPAGGMRSTRDVAISDAEHLLQNAGLDLPRSLVAPSSTPEGELLADEAILAVTTARISSRAQRFGPQVWKRLDKLESGRASRMACVFAEGAETRWLIYDRTRLGRAQRNR